MSRRSGAERYLVALDMRKPSKKVINNSLFMQDGFPVKRDSSNGSAVLLEIIQGFG
jgi:hypothetical protein